MEESLAGISVGVCVALGSLLCSPWPSKTPVNGSSLPLVFHSLELMDLPLTLITDFLLAPLSKPWTPTTYSPPLLGGRILLGPRALSRGGLSPSISSRHMCLVPCRWRICHSKSFTCQGGGRSPVGHHQPSEKLWLKMIGPFGSESWQFAWFMQLASAMRL